MTTTGEESFASIPTKFRKFLYAGPNTFLVCEPIPEGNKVNFEVVNVLYCDQVKYFLEKGVWPEEFLHFKSVKKIYDKIQNLKKEAEKAPSLFNDQDGDSDLCGFEKFDPTKQLYGCNMEFPESSDEETSEDDDSSSDTNSETEDSEDDSPDEESVCS